MAFEMGEYALLNEKCNYFKNIRDSIESMPKFNQVEILRILTATQKNQNNNGNIEDEPSRIVHNIIKIYLTIVGYILLI